MQTVAGSFLWSRRSTELVGLPALAAAVLKSGLVTEPGWFFTNPDAVALWCEVGGMDVETFYKSLAAYARRKWAA